MCCWPQAEYVCESIAAAGKSESVLWAAVPACLSLVFAAQWEKRIWSKSLVAQASALGKHSILWDFRGGSVGCSCYRELVSTAQCNKPTWSEILFSWASRLPETDARLRLWKEPYGKGHVFHCAPQEHVWGRCSTLPGEKSRSRWPSGLETVAKQESRPWQAQGPVAIQVSPAPCVERRKPGC